MLILRTTAFPTNAPAITDSPTIKPCKIEGNGSAPNCRKVATLLIIKASELAASVDRKALLLTTRRM